jgi:hypothetical protein
MPENTGRAPAPTSREHWEPGDAIRTSTYRSHEERARKCHDQSAFGTFDASDQSLSRQVHSQSRRSRPHELQ